MEKAIILRHNESCYSFDVCTFLKILFIVTYSRKAYINYHSAMKIFQYFKGLMEGKTKEL